MNDWRTYDGIADTYERVFAPRFSEPARDLVALAAPPPGGRVLDVGTGTGVAADAAASAVGTDGLALGVDVSIGMIRTARAARPSLRIAAADAIDLPFRGGTFDVVTANFVISHFPSYKTALFDMIRVLRPGGRLAVSAWADVGADDLQRTWRELVETVVQEELLDDVARRAVPWQERFADREKVEEALLDAGLRHIRTEKREYHFQYPLADYVAGRAASSTGRFAREMLGPQAWESFYARVVSVFAERFADPLNDFEEVWLAVGTKQ